MTSVSAAVAIPNGDEFELSDIGNAMRFIYGPFGEDVRYVPAARTWMYWDGRRWAADEIRTVRRWAQETIVSLFEYVAKIPDDKARERLAKHAIHSQSDQRIRALLACAEAIQDVAVRPAAFECEPVVIQRRERDR